MARAFDAIRFFRDHHISYSTEGKNVREGWISYRCPFCDDHSNHGHVDPSSGAVGCWRCKAGSLASLASKLLHLPFAESVALLDGYRGADYSRITNRKSQIANRKSTLEIPGGELSGAMCRYLQGRGFDPAELQARYGIRGLKHGGIWEGIDFSYRIVIPVMDRNGRIVSFQARDYTGKQELRYKNCPMEKSILDPKDCLYAAHMANRNRVVVVEGIFDMWRMGPGFVCSFGTSMRESQVRLLAEWQEVIFLFDPEPTAQAHAREYAVQLASLGVSCSLVEADFGLNEDGSARDPGDLTEAEAATVRRELLI